MADSAVRDALQHESSRLELAVVGGDDSPAARAVKQMYETGDYNGIALSPSDEHEAIELLAGMGKFFLFDELVAGAERLAESIHSIATRGLQEVVQNAEDQQASTVRFGYRKGRKGAGELLVAHDGKPVELRDVLRMSLPLISGSREDAEKIGQFGVGLKTLKQLGRELQVHCRPLPSFSIEDGRIKPVSTAQPISGFWNANARETLFVLSLKDKDFDLAFFERWIAGWDASSLLFLDHVSSVALIDLGRRKRTVRACRLQRSSDRTVDLAIPRATEIRESTITEPGSNRRWTRYVARFATPQRLADKVDHLGNTLDVRIALPNREQQSRVYVGLPLEEPSSLPYSVGSKHFKLSADRTDLLEHKRNSWLVDAIGELATAIAVRQLGENPKRAWRAIALSGDTCGSSEWVKSQFERLVTRQWRELDKRAALGLADGDVRLNDLIYETEELDGLLDTRDIERLWQEEWDETRKTVPKRARDGGRWRDVLSDRFCEAQVLDFQEARGAFDWPDDEVASRGSGWLVDLVAAGITLGAERELLECRCIPLARGGGRLSPREVIDGGALLVHTLPKEGLAASLKLAQQIALKLRSRSRNARAVRRWLSENGALQEKASDAASIRALARGDGTEPHDLQRREAVLKRLQNSFDQLAPEERAVLGPGVGKNIEIKGYVHHAGRKQVMAVKPADAYLSSRIDSGPFPKAAGKTDGLRWVDPSYRDVLSGPRGRGALAFLRELGSATAPRLISAEEPTRKPHAPKLFRERTLNAQQKAELGERREATGLRHDWLSPDADAVVANIASERKLIDRQSRARALILAFEERWSDYADKVEAEAVSHYGSFISHGPVTATWLARLASEPWLTTREPGLHRARPRDLAVLTETSFDLEGENRASYSGELEAEDADLAFVAALGVKGRPRASDVIAELEGLKDAEARGETVEPRQADRCLEALSHFVSGGRHESESDLLDTDIRSALTDPGRKGGLIRVSGAWLSPVDVRRGPPLHDSVPCTNVAPALLEAIGVPEPSAAECVEALEAMARDKTIERTGEFRAFERLLAIAGDKPRSLGPLKRAPLRLHSGWKRSRGREQVFAVSDPILARQLGERWPVWDPPMPLARLAPLVDRLGVAVLDPANFEPDIPAALLERELDRVSDYRAAVDRFRAYLQVHHPDLYERVGATTWRSLSEAALVISGDWKLRVRAPGKRPEHVPVRAHLFLDPNAVCVVDEDQLGRRDGAGQAIAGRVAGPDASEADLSTLALVWAESYRDDSAPEFELDPLEEPEAAPGLVEFEQFRVNTRKRGGKRLKRIRTKEPAAKEEPRRLHDAEDLDLGGVQGLLLEGTRRGTTVRLSSKAKLIPSTKSSAPSKARNGVRAGNRDYTEEEKEDLALALVSTVLAKQKGLRLEDIREQANAGADAVDRQHDIWVELKAHGKDMPDVIRLEPSEFELAETKKGKYWLAIVWGLEASRKPDYVLISDPLRRLDRTISGRIHLSGIADLRSKSAAS
jgi:Protein NO VEIN, C-terminal